MSGWAEFWTYSETQGLADTQAVSLWMTRDLAALIRILTLAKTKTVL